MALICNIFNHRVSGNVVFDGKHVVGLCKRCGKKIIQKITERNRIFSYEQKNKAAIEYFKKLDEKEAKRPFYHVIGPIGRKN